MYKKILIPLENSECDAIILEHIKRLAKLTKSKLILVHVADGFAALLQDQLNLEDSEEIIKDRKYLKEKEDELIAAGFSVKSYLASGDPSDKILKIVEKEECDLIAMSTHGHRFIKDIFLGSVADTLRHKTSIPILMIRAKLE